MELWIRSQNKGALLKANIIGNTDGVIKNYSEHNQTTLGEYKSSERALEVLDEIQNILSLGLQVNNNNQICGTTTYVYEMPKE